MIIKPLLARDEANRQTAIWVEFKTPHQSYQFANTFCKGMLFFLAENKKYRHNCQHTKWHDCLPIIMLSGKSFGSMISESELVGGRQMEERTDGKIHEHPLAKIREIRKRNLQITTLMRTGLESRFSETPSENKIDSNAQGSAFTLALNRRLHDRTALWFRRAMNRDLSTGPLAPVHSSVCSFTHTAH